MKSIAIVTITRITRITITRITIIIIIIIMIVIMIIMEVCLAVVEDEGAVGRQAHQLGHQRALPPGAAPLARVAPAGPPVPDDPRLVVDVAADGDAEVHVGVVQLAPEAGQGPGQPAREAVLDR